MLPSTSLFLVITSQHYFVMDFSWYSYCPHITRSHLGDLSDSENLSCLNILNKRIDLLFPFSFSVKICSTESLLYTSKVLI
jgi:hypothetical protein